MRAMNACEDCNDQNFSLLEMSLLRLVMEALLQTTDGVSDDLHGSILRRVLAVVTERLQEYQLQFQ